ncbi:TRAP transporter substrate-binding protein [Rhodobacter sp. NTK016B]|uniref:TRAP transporter substrate-binding protein n=1 Tax=Rhodobacter sp. NTK016B TaxID=2759676 RepID=UPI001A8E498E|nr:TRAP transporter substrate-binding protein [Rhodobacter sp. NTK016B]MBN8294075.1 TRAP transporter substrate-binding protein [Rhodobacter sp. NTK016B]
MTIAKTFAAATLAMGLAQGALAEELKLADFQPPTHFIVDSVYTPFGEAISQATDGDVTLRVYMGGELGPGPAEQYNRVLDGVTDIAFSLPGYTASSFPMTLLAELPGVLTAETGTQAIVDNLDMLAPEYRRAQLVGLWNNAPNLLLMGSREVDSLDDLAGLNIRVPSRNAGLIVQAWGANPVSMPAPEIYNAMQTGVIDGAMIDATTLGAFRLAEVTQSVTMGMDTTISLFFMVMNRDTFEGLSDDAQAAIVEAGRTASLTGSAQWLEVAARALAAFESTDGKTVITLSPEEAARFNEASAPVVEQIIAETEANGIPAQAYVAALRGE